MLTKLGLELTGRHHSGIDDTRNIAKILLRIKNEHLTTKQLLEFVRDVPKS